MPQLDITSFASQLFWLAVCFPFLYIVLAAFVLPKVSSVLQSRQDRITSDLDKAEHLKREAEILRTEYEKTVAESKEKAALIVSEAIAKSKENSEKEHAKLTEKLKKELEKAEKRIAKSREKAMEQVMSMSTELAHMVVKKVGVDAKPVANQDEPLLKEAQ